MPSEHLLRVLCVTYFVFFRAFSVSTPKSIPMSMVDLYEKNVILELKINF